MACDKMREIKLCLLGDSGVGKSCLALRFAHDRFKPNSEMTIGATYMSKTVKINGHCLKYNIWDTAGQERYKALAPMYYRGAAAAIIVYDITSELTFNSVKRWVKELEHNGPEDLVIAIAGNKKDLTDEREVSNEAGKIYANEVGAIFFECSAFTGENVEELFKTISQKLPPEKPGLQNLSFSPKSIQKKKESKCCS